MRKLTDEGKFWIAVVVLNTVAIMFWFGFWWLL